MCSRLMSLGMVKIDAEPNTQRVKDVDLLSHTERVVRSLKICNSKMNRATRLQNSKF